MRTLGIARRASRLFAFFVEFFNSRFGFILALGERLFGILQRVEWLGDHFFDGFSSLGYGVRLRVAAEKG